MNKRILTTVMIYLALLAGLAMAEPPTKKTPRMSVGEKHIYKTLDDKELSLYIVKPDDWKATDRRPAAVFFHGGGWIGGGPFQFNEHSKYLASRGMVCVQVQYRLLAKKSTDSPEKCINDAKSAMRWVRSRAGQLGIDPDRIASGGGSAGGHLAAFVGIMDGMDDPKDDLKVSAKSNAMMLFNPVFDNGPEGFGHKRVGEQYRKYSPFHNISKGDPPSIVFFGDKDNLVPVATAEAFRKQMTDVGTDCEVIIFKDMPHAFFNYSKYGHVPYYKTILACDRFLVDLGWLKGPATLQVPEEKLGKVESYSVE